MLLDYVGIIPGAAALAIGLVTLVSKDTPKWNKIIVAILTVVAIGATGASQWWTNTKSAEERAEKTAIREQLGEFENQGNRLIAITLNNDLPLPQEDADKWGKEIQTFLATKLGRSYVIRFYNDSGIPLQGTPLGIQMNRMGLLQWLHYRIARLDQFASEVSR